ncbi:MAG TPA: GNAT family N-acetyltransferase [Streptosporangiaceae bacterium]
MRQATAKDLDTIHAVIQAAYAKYLSRMPKPPAPMLRDYTGPIEQGSVWVTGQPITGLISLTPAGDRLLVENIAVHPAAQGTGLGAELMRFAEQQAAQRKLRRLTLYTHEVMTENQAIYAHLGYHEVDRRTEDGYRRIYMQKILRGQPSSAGGSTSA